MDDKEREIMRLMYDFHIELAQHQGVEIRSLKAAVDSLERSHEILIKIMKATGDLMGTH